MNEKTSSPRDISPIDELISRAKEEGHVTSEIKVWETDTISVPLGQMGLIKTDELNGCHVSIIVTPSEDGHGMTMTHFPPDLGAERYRRALEEVSGSVQSRGAKPEAVVTLTASDRPAPEDTWAANLFPDAPFRALYYKARDPERHAKPDAGKCVAILDARSDDAPQLHVMTDSGDQSIALSPLH